MLFSRATFLLCAASAIVGVASQDELPITTSDVFIQSGEISADSIIIMARCNSEEDSEVTLFLNDESNQQIDVSSVTDFTVSFKVEGLQSNTAYSYFVQCQASATSEARQEPSRSLDGSFKTTPSADEAAPVSFVWVADLAGQSYGRNPDFELVTTGGKTVSGGYIVFDTMEDLEPDFALFQGMCIAMRRTWNDPIRDSQNFQICV
jgi:alkaline phosphatase D